ncbi:ribbon-helix-helix protein, CopG family [Tsuneonella mangrovi]|uniref:ribbon-helix-helix protein, CopG family n=1 Tax=Tsuneonella mangrovi TaxID=1982042 RepID=UPI000BA28FEF|nr:ribbon-helix-helix protein, CopG family [Tsuneonella mangrovi]
MARILADLPDDDIRWLDQLAQEQGKSRAAVLREAVAAYRGSTGGEGIERFFGIWRDRSDGQTS